MEPSARNMTHVSNEPPLKPAIKCDLVHFTFMCNKTMKCCMQTHLRPYSVMTWTEKCGSHIHSVTAHVNTKTEHCLQHVVHSDHCALCGVRWNYTGYK